MDKYEELLQKITNLVLEDKENYLENGVRFFEPPLIGIANASDLLFKELKKREVVGEVHFLPRELLPQACSVVSYFLPYSREIRQSNYQKKIVSEEWMHSRFLGEAFNNKVRKFLVELLVALGGQAISPVLEEKYHVDYEYYRSNWSERHVAFTAGLGTFGLNRGLITQKGISGRFGSAITTLKLEETPRPYENVFQYCPWMKDGSCGSCIERCPAGAITDKGMDKHRCRQHLLNSEQAREAKEKFNYTYNACGKCLTNVPCEDRVPFGTNNYKKEVGG
jgi:epoxyqueuosine reductase QueG